MIRTYDTVWPCESVGCLTVADLHTLRASHGGEIVTDVTGVRLVGAIFDGGRLVDLGPVRAMTS